MRTWRVGITGHLDLTPATSKLVLAACTALLASRGTNVRLLGVTCLAEGADQVFAEATLHVGGSYDVILPAADYRDVVVRPGNRQRFDRLLKAARTCIALPRKSSDAEAYAAANAEMLARVDELVAVWDCRDNAAAGSSANAVTVARRLGIPVTRLWPSGAQRRSEQPVTP